MRSSLPWCILFAFFFVSKVASEGVGQGKVEQLSKHVGQMSMELQASSHSGTAQRETLRFEPWQMLDDLFRDDIVLLMRHGPTDWSKRDAVNVEPTDCSNQRLMTEVGQSQMRDLGILLAGNGIIPGQIIVSEWCRAEQTLEALLDGLALIEPGYRSTVSVVSSPDANLLLSLQGAPHVSVLRESISSWTGDNRGPLLIISHFTNIAEITEFNVYEGEMLVIDPTLDNRVLGYLRLHSAAPDEGHFDTNGRQ